MPVDRYLEQKLKHYTMMGLLASSVIINAALFGRFWSEDSAARVEYRERIRDLEAQVANLSSMIGELESVKPPLIVIRIDDVQDFAFRDAQLFLLRYNMANGIPVSLAVIPKMLGADLELVESVSRAVRLGSEVTTHGWEHEDFSQLSQDKQESRLRAAKERLGELLGVKASILVPPMFDFNRETLLAMSRTGYSMISSSLELDYPGMTSEGIVHVPSTVEFSDYVNGTWHRKYVEGLYEEVLLSILKHGYAVIVLHPQELMREGSLDWEAIEIYDSLVFRIMERYTFTIIHELNGRVSGLNMKNGN